MLSLSLTYPHSKAETISITEGLIDLINKWRTLSEKQNRATNKVNLMLVRNKT
jgi:hypothetical protein